MIEGIGPAFVGFDWRRGDHVPDFDLARGRSPGAFVDDRCALLAQTTLGVLARIDQIDEFQHFPCGTERDAERNSLELSSRGLGLALGVAPLLGKALRPSALEGVDRLFLVAHGEERADTAARSFAGKEFARQRPDDVPLQGCGVLRLVDENVVDALIELVMDPCASTGSRQQCIGGRDQVVEVEKALPTLQSLEGRDVAPRQMKGREIVSERVEGRQLLKRRGDLRLGFLDPVLDVGDDGLHRLRANILERLDLSRGTQERIRNDTCLLRGRTMNCPEHILCKS